jgi:predicted DNA-binding transcriptional regulator YafY
VVDKKIERVTLLHRVLKAARMGRTIDELEAELGVSRATVYRDLDFLREVLGAPLNVDDQRRWRYARDEQAPFELPGLWLNAEELYALVLTRQIVEGTKKAPHLHSVTSSISLASATQQTSSSQQGSVDVAGADEYEDRDESLLGASLAAAQNRIEKLLGEKAVNLKRLRVLRHNHRRVDERVFRSIAAATLERRPLRFGYRARSTDEPTTRTVHPQRLVHYRDNWYLDAFDDTREALRSFALDRVSDVKLLEGAAKELQDSELDAALTTGYGIFSGAARNTATILFSAHAARWAAEERWHTQQLGKFLNDGRFELKVPYSNGRELLMDVLRYGPDAEITAPIALREQMRSLLTLTSESYGLGV